jgi:tetratricopeptide (TPR) repeat protein
MGRDREALAVCRAFAEKRPQSSWTPDVMFWIGKYEFNQADYVAAEQAFTELVSQAPRHELADDALLWAGLSASRHKEYLRANELFTRLVKEYPESPKMAEARFAQGEALAELANYAEAILIFDEVIKKYPDSGLVDRAWGRKADCQFVLGGEDARRFQESMDSYQVVAGSATAGQDMTLQAEYKIGRCLEKLNRTDDALSQYYAKVVARYLEDSQKGVWHSEGAKLWFMRGAFNAADILEARKDWRGAVRVLERVVRAGVPAAEEAKERIRKVQAEHWWMF